MSEIFEIVGRILNLQPKIDRNGKIVPGFWLVTLETARGPETCSFASTLRGSIAGSRFHNPDFKKLVNAKERGEIVGITGVITKVSSGPYERTFNDGLRAEVISTIELGPAGERRVRRPSER